MNGAEVWGHLGWPLLRLIISVSFGLFVAILIESLNWTHFVARLAGPVVRLARLKDIAGASFSMAFFSGLAANSMLAEQYEKRQLSDRELVLSNLFNSLPTFFIHLPQMFFVALSFLGGTAFIYIGMTLLAAFLRTACIVVLGRLFLPPLPEGCITCILDEQKAKKWADALDKTWRRFKRRILRILLVTIPVYIVIYYANKYGIFLWLENAMTSHVGALAILPPQAMSIVVFQMAAEMSAGLAAAGSLLNAGGLAPREIVLALLVGNILSTPMRAFRHQFPFYAGIFKPRTALKLIAYNQSLRAASLLTVAIGYYFFSLWLGAHAA